MDLTPQHFYAETVNGTYKIIDMRTAAHHPADARPHLLGRFVGESHAEDIGWINPHFFHKIGISCRKHTGLSGTRACRDAYFPFCFRHSFELILV